jgi:hypothetical protein
MENELVHEGHPTNIRPATTKVRVGPKSYCKSEPEVIVNRQGDRVESIVFKCSCGEEVTVTCDYGEQVSP